MCVLRIRGVCVNECFALVMCCCCCSRSRSETKYTHTQPIHFWETYSTNMRYRNFTKIICWKCMLRLPINLLFTYIHSRTLTCARAHTHTHRIHVFYDRSTLNILKQAKNFYLICQVNQTFHSLFVHLAWIIFVVSLRQSTASRSLSLSLSRRSHELILCTSREQIIWSRCFIQSTQHQSHDTFFRASIWRK